MEPEVLFLKYAFPCTFIKRQKGKVNDEEYQRLETAAINNEKLPKDFLERIYDVAFKNISKIARKMEKETWDADVIREYFLKEHNVLIDNGEIFGINAPETLRDLCRVHKARILEFKNGALIVEYNGRKRTVLESLVKDVKVGDIVSIHYGYAVEKLDLC